MRTKEITGNELFENKEDQKTKKKPERIKIKKSRMHVYLTDDSIIKMDERVDDIEDITQMLCDRSKYVQMLINDDLRKSGYDIKGSGIPEDRTNKKIRNGKKGKGLR